MGQNYADDMFDPVEEQFFKHEISLRALLEQSKMWSKFVKDLSKYFEYRAQCEIEYYKNVKKSANIVNFDAQLRSKEFVSLSCLLECALVF